MGDPLGLAIVWACERYEHNGSKFTACGLSQVIGRMCLFVGPLVLDGRVIKFILYGRPGVIDLGGGMYEFDQTFKLVTEE